MDIVKEVLSKDELQKSEAVESIQVHKLIPLECFPQDLLVCDTNEINLPEYKKNTEEYVLSLSRDCVQHLLNTISTCPKERKDDKLYINLPGPAYNLPREKPAPIPKPLTKWQRFALEKGIKKKKKPKTTWDDILKRWVPTYGYKKAAAEKEKNWLLEVPANVDPNTDMFAEKTKTKKENVAKNEYQRLRNVAAARKVKVPKVAVPPMESNFHIPQLQVAADVARTATASMGKFQAKLPNEKSLFQTTTKAKKRFLNAEQERKENLKISEKILNKKPKMDLSKAVNRHIHEEETERRTQKSERKGGKKRKRTDTDNSKKNKNNFKKPKFSKGKRMGGKQKSSGRKRR